jgi:hypothetical protein
VNPPLTGGFDQPCCDGREAPSHVVSGEPDVEVGPSSPACLALGGQVSHRAPADSLVLEKRIEALLAQRRLEG